MSGVGNLKQSGTYLKLFEAYTEVKDDLKPHSGRREVEAELNFPGRPI